MILVFLIVIMSAGPLSAVSSSTTPLTAYGTWFAVSPISNAIPPQMCDQAVAFDRERSRMLIWDGNDPNADVVSDMWQFDLTTFEAAEWSIITLLPNTTWALPQRTAPLSVMRQSSSDDGAATIYSFGGHAINTIIVPHDITSIQVGTDTINNGTYWNDFGLLYPANISDPNVDSAADDPAVQPYQPWPQGRAWGVMEWIDINQTIAIMFGGTDEDGLDSAEVWLCNMTTSPPTWTLLNTTGDSPGKLSGHKSAIWNNSLYIYGGYNCTSGGNSALGSAACFNQDIYILPLSTNATACVYDNAYVWRGIHANAQSTYWPERRAWHAMVQYDNKLWAFGGTYIDGSASQYFFNDVVVFDLINEQWMTPFIQGSVPPVMWSHTLTVAHDEFGIYHAILFGGCTVSAYYSDVYALKLNLVIQPSQVNAIGLGLIQSIAGTYASFQLQTQNNTINDSDINNNTLIWTNILTWGIGLKFDVFIIGKVGSISTRLESTVTEIGEGLYNITYLSYGGGSSSSTSCSSQSNNPSNELVVSVLLNNQHIIGSPFLVESLPGILTSNHTIVPVTTNTVINYYSPYDAVKNQITTFTIIPADNYGNIAITPQNISRVNILITDINNNDNININNLNIISTDDGLYLVSYITPKVNAYLLSIYFDDIQILSSPYIINPYNNLNVSFQTYLLVIILAIFTTIFLIIISILLIYYRKHPVFKASSVSFMSLILFGMFCIIFSLYLPPITEVNQIITQVTENDGEIINDSQLSHLCSADIWLLSIGFTIAFSSICMKTWRIKQIFASRQLKIFKITDLQMFIPILILIIIDIILLSLWTFINPLIPTDHISDNNKLIHYISCDGSQSTIWLFIICFPKISLIIYSIYLAISIRAVPNQFNESKMIGLAIYNVTFALIILISVIYLLLNDQPTKKYVLINIITSYCVIITILLLFIPRLLQIYGFMESIPQQVNPVTSMMVIPAMHSPITSKDGIRNTYNNKIKSFPSFPSRKKMLEHGENDLVERKKPVNNNQTDELPPHKDGSDSDHPSNESDVVTTTKSPVSAPRAVTTLKSSVSVIKPAINKGKRPSSLAQPQSPLLEQHHRSQNSLPGSTEMSGFIVEEN